MQIILSSVEKRESEIAGLIARIHLIGGAGPLRRRRPVPIHRDRDRDHGIERRIAQFRPGAAVDHAGGHVEEEIDNARLVVPAEQPAVQLFQLRSDTG